MGRGPAWIYHLRFDICYCLAPTIPFISQQCIVSVARRGLCRKRSFSHDSRVSRLKILLRVSLSPCGTMVYICHAGHFSFDRAPMFVYHVSNITLAMWRRLTGQPDSELGEWNGRENRGGDAEVTWRSKTNAILSGEMASPAFARAGLLRSSQ